MLYLKSAVFTFFCFFFYGLAIGQGLLVFPKDSSVFDQTDLQMEWNSSSGANSYDLQVSTDESFTSLVVEENNLNTLSFLAQNLAPNSVYYWRVKPNNFSWSSIYSFTIVDFRTWPELEFMLDPDSVILDANGSVQQWTDLSGNGHHFGQSTAAKRPTPIIDPQANNQTIIAFNPNLQNYIDGVNLSGLSQGEIFSLVKRTTYIPTSLNKGGIWKFGNNSEVDFYPSTTPSVAMGFGRNTRFIIGDISSLSDITKNHILNISSNLEFDLQINRTNIFNSNTGITNFSSVCSIGKSHGNYFFDGHFGQILLFNASLNDSLRNLVYVQMQHKYAPPVNLGHNISYQYGFCKDTTLYAGKRFTSYLWSDGSTADSLVVSEPGTYWVEVEDIFGFISRDTIEVVSGLNYPTTQLYCQNDSIIWQTGLGQHYSYLWSDGSTADTLVINSPGDIHVAITDTNGCVFQSDTLSFAADLFSTTATLGADHDLCSGNNLSLLSGASEAVSYLWNTGSTAASIPIENSGIYSVEVTNNNGCVAKDTVEITIIGEAPVLEIDFPQNVCLSAPFEFEDVSTTTDGSTLSSWTWEFGDGNISALEEGTHYYSGLGNYEVNYTVGTTAGCYRDTTFTIAVKDNPVLSFSSSGVCQGDEIQFYGGQLTPFLISDWTWDFGDASASISGQNVIHNYTAHGEFEVQLIGTDVYGCKDTVNTSKLISPLPEVMFSYNEICEGKVVNFQNQTTIASPSTISSYFWNFGDGTTSGQTNPQKPYITYGEYTISLTAVNEEGCSASKSNLLKVHATPAVDYAIEQACSGLSTVLKDESFVADGSVAQVDWSINGAAPLSGFSLEKTYDYPGTYQLKQTVKSAFGCSNSKESLFEIQEALSAAFSFSPNAFIVGETTVFVNETQGGSAVQWSFGDFATAQQDTSLVFTEEQIGEEITVQLWVENENGCVDSVSVTREVVSRETDLLISEIFTQEVDGFLTIGVRLKNEGATPIENVELTLQKSGNILLKEIWTGELQANEEEVYVFSAALSSFIAMEDSLSQYICIRGRIINSSFQETDLSNNEFCRTLNTSQSIIIQPYPNPVRTQLTIRLLMPFEENGSLMMYDNYGRLVKNVFENKKLEVGLNSIEVDVSQIASGKYSIVYRGERQVQIANVVVAN